MLPDCFFYFILFFSLKGMIAIDLHFMNHQAPWFQLKNHLHCSTKEKVAYILDGLRASKLTAHFHFLGELFL